ncbi:kynureninase [Cellulosimicrobium arenosum]|uniref:Kynureninase n=1 Tax=Cellulosimicrobium arenosum TaxID=2708133 RepID=A0A927PFC1_9MICO|nr:aminotransferase class V-fold PLP-dependent enzyme [Cellulosimicrobium arenosum]MBD8079939.1 aminotransferase class V-fold PLP-dependent enzyme [Cellulosimicrobium arenosum]
MSTPTSSSTSSSSGTEQRAARAAALDAADPLARYVGAFVPSADVVAYLDGNSLGRPTRASAERLARFATEQWGARLIRGWDEEWYDLPLTLGDRIGAAALGAGPGQAFVADSTTVILYKLVRAALGAPSVAGRDEVVLDSGNFPTDRYVLEGVAREHGVTLRWVAPAHDGGVTPEQVAEVLTDRTALVVLSHVAYRSGYLSDAAGITRLAHDAGALVLWDLCHSAGAVPVELDAWGVDLAVGCTYKYLNGGPGAPAFGYVRADLQDALTQPIQGWMGSAAPFEMGPGYAPHPGARGFLSGTPAIVGMLAMQDMVDLVAEAGMGAIRAKSVALTELALELVDDLLVPLGARVASPRDTGLRGSHVTVDHEAFEATLPLLWARGVIPDFRRPDGLRLGLSPLSTSFDEVRVGVEAVRDALAEVTAARAR